MVWFFNLTKENDFLPKIVVLVRLITDCLNQKVDVRKRVGGIQLQLNWNFNKLVIRRIVFNGSNFVAKIDLLRNSP